MREMSKLWVRLLTFAIAPPMKLDENIITSRRVNWKSTRHMIRVCISII